MFIYQRVAVILFEETMSPRDGDGPRMRLASIQLNGIANVSDTMYLS